MHKIKIVKKNIKNFYIKIKPSLEVILTAPLNISDEYINTLLQNKTNWINQKLSEFKKENQKIIKYVDGDSMKFLGEEYLLKILYTKKEELFIKNDMMYLCIKEDSCYEKREKIVNSWYKKEAREYFLQVINRYQPIVNKRVNSLKIRDMTTRWGSCNYTKGYINLNLQLIKQPIKAIEYVVFHELTHLIYPNHSRDFYAYLDKHMSDWRERREELML